MNDSVSAPVQEVSPIEQVAPGVLRQWLHNGNLICYEISDTSRPAIDAWINAARATANSWKFGQPVLSLYEFTDRKMQLTPYLQRRASELRVMRPDLRVWAAIVLPNTLTSQLLGHAVQMFLQVVLRPNSYTQIFYSRAKALAWLEEHISVFNSD